MQEEFRRLQGGGAKFVIPVTSLIEVGNFIAGCTGDRRAAARRFAEAIRAAKTQSPPWIIREVNWDDSFIQAIVEGDSTGADLVGLLGDGRLGVGDIAILVERDRFRAESAYRDVKVWTLDAGLDAFN